MADISISGFTIKEYDAIFSLWKSCDGIGLSAADSRENIRLFLDRNPGMNFAVYEGGVIVGAVLSGHDGRRGYIYHLAVHPDYRGQVVGKMFAEKCTRALKSAGIQKAHIFILNGNHRGMGFWKKIGWTKRTDITVSSKQIE